MYVAILEKIIILNISINILLVGESTSQDEISKIIDFIPKIIDLFSKQENADKTMYRYVNDFAPFISFSSK